MALFKKTTAPDELPDLAIDELKKGLSKDYSQKEETPKPEEVPKVVEEKKEETPKPEEVQAPEEKETKEDSKEEIAPSPQNQEEVNVEGPVVEEKIEEPNKSSEKINEEEVNLERSFFNPLLEELKKENFDPSKINLWYQKKFSEKGAIEEMKEYWEKQKDTFITDAVEKEFKERISTNMKRLQKLESEWQEIYIKLVKKEEEMKKEEKNIKKIIKDFSQVFGKKRNVKKEHKSR
jgi:hypothetical protein